MDEERMKEIRARLEAATPGPWKEGKQYGGCIEVTSPSGHVCDVDEDFCGVSNGLNDLRLIAHAPTDIADLLREVEDLRPFVDRLQEAHEERADLQARIEKIDDIMSAGGSADLMLHKINNVILGMEEGE